MPPGEVGRIDLISEQIATRPRKMFSAAHDAVIAQALKMMESRLQCWGDALNSPKAVRDDTNRSTCSH